MKSASAAIRNIGWVVKRDRRQAHMRWIEGLLDNGASEKTLRRIMGIWSGMLQRCYNPRAESYRYYGARGIEVCEEWRGSVRAFYEWAVANDYAPGLSIDRRDNYRTFRGYSLENCRWLSLSDQQKNKRKHQDAGTAV